ncbi:signal peptidase II [Spiroplasma endosymbiont of Labia minor]|uniref:signal peptidase II n=1 Tax=Spiroplasma endosymbiont of Labia minor TaxID=3066305 RepID=UPI0030D06633
MKQQFKLICDKVLFFLRNYNFDWKFKLICCLPLFIFLVAFDWITKSVIQTSMSYGETKDFIPGFLNLKYILNPGSAYGMNSDNPALAISLASVITFLLIFVLIFVNSKTWIIGITFLFAGSFANLLARAWAPSTPDGIHGGVVDFLVWDIKWFGSVPNYIFNIADVWVNIAIAYLIIRLIVTLILLLINFIKIKKGLLIQDEDGKWISSNKDKKIPNNDSKINDSNKKSENKENE